MTQSETHLQGQSSTGAPLLVTQNRPMRGLTTFCLLYILRESGLKQAEKNMRSRDSFPPGSPQTLRGGCIMVNMIELSDEIKRELAFSEEEKKELEKARNMPITFDEDCPETTPERALRFRRVNPRRKATGSPA